MRLLDQFLRAFGLRRAIDESQRLAGRQMIEALREAGPFEMEVQIGDQRIKFKVRIPPEKN